MSDPTSDFIPDPLPQPTGLNEQPPEATTSTASSSPQPLVYQLYQRARQGVATYLQREFIEFREQVGQLDQQLAEHYPQRYPQWKQQAQQQFGQAKTRLQQVADPVITKLQTLDPEFVAQQQTRLEAKAGDWGKIVAQQEQRLKQYLRQQLQQR